MDYKLSSGAQSLNIYAVDARKNASRIVLTAGEGKLSKAEYEAIRDHKVVLAHVADGKLRFPGDKAMEKLASEGDADRRARAADQQDRRENGASSQDVAALAELVAEQAAQIAELQARLEADPGKAKS
jgi:hypothetical protein